MLEPTAVDHYEYLLFTIEFATQNCQSIMTGCANLYCSENDPVTAVPAANKAVISGNKTSSFYVGETIFFGTSMWGTEQYTAYNTITAIERCDADGTPNTSGSYTLFTYDGTDRSSSITTGTTKIVSKPWKAGATEGYSGLGAVKGHTGSPVSNTSNVYPMRYRWRENIYGNQYMTSHDMANVRVDNGDDTYHLEWYYNADPRKVTAPYNYGASDLTEAKGWVKLSAETPSAGYVTGYITEMSGDETYPFVQVPTKTGGSATTYYCDYAYLVYSSVVRCVRRRGYSIDGTYDGFRCFFANYSPSIAAWAYGGQLYFIQ